MSDKKRFRVHGEYRISFDVELEADSAEEAQANVRDDPELALSSCISESFDFDDCEEVNDAD